MNVNSYEFTVGTVCKPLAKWVQLQAFLDSFSYLHNNLERGKANYIILCGDFTLDLLQNLSSHFFAFNVLALFDTYHFKSH